MIELFIWKYGFYLFKEMKKEREFDVKFMDLWKTKKISHNKFKRSLQLIKGIKLNSKIDEINLYTTPLLSKSFKINKTKKNVVMIHDLYTLRDNRNKLLKLLTKYLYFKSQAADTILTNSNITLREYEYHYGNQENIFKIYLGLDEKFLKIKKKGKNRKLTFISIGRDEPRKNLSFLIKLLGELSKEKIDFNMIRVGNFNNYHKKLIKKLGIKKKVEIISRISEKELINLYSQSHILLFPSLYEGFGLPPLEAMSQECIPLVSSRGSLPEIVKNKKLILPLDRKIWIEKIKEIQNNKELVEFGKEHSSKFTWKNHVEELIKIIK